ncbi:ankyrin repeat domain-containing protein [Methylocucumis oryzae]|uniref:Ankyrin n=1 Tax=Methylocucumis oryzae TaxID=1632867 RepID=A0A0F3IJ74_9GAMM|nr:ankyrin repeat domain-containing protein [Methylocucumis oryzae]KJV05589.1 ankyrin [Methylocucumis oryzae]
MDAVVKDWWAEQGSADERQALIVACRQGRSDIVQALVSSGVSLSAIDAYGNNALWAACYSESLACIHSLLAAGIDKDYQNPDTGATALMYAASSGKAEVVECLLAAGADYSLKSKDDFTALDLASTRKILKLLSSLVVSGV